MAERRESERLRGKRSRILYEVTGLVVVLFIASGLLTFFFVNSAFNRLVNESIDKVVEEQAATIHTGLLYAMEIEAQEILGDYEKYTTQEIIDMTMESFETGEMSELGRKATERLQNLVDNGVLGMELIIELTLASPPVIPQDTIILTTDEKLFSTKPPEVVLSAIEEAEEGGELYVYLEEGIPELGLEGEHLMSLSDISKLSPSFRGTWGANFVSMQEVVADIRDFYNSEKSRATMVIAFIIFGSIVLAILITFFVLSSLMRRRITEPIDALSAAAGEVMGGDLDVEVEVHEGGDFEGLERAFKEMVESIRKYIARSVGE